MVHLITFKNLNFGLFDPLLTSKIGLNMLVYVVKSNCVSLKRVNYRLVVQYNRLVWVQKFKFGNGGRNFAQNPKNQF